MFKIKVTRQNISFPPNNYLEYTSHYKNKTKEKQNIESLFVHNQYIFINVLLCSRWPLEKKKFQGIKYYQKLTDYCFLKK